MKPKIVILSAFSSPLRSGAEACAEEVSALLKDKYNFTIVTARMSRSLPKNDQISGIDVIRVGFGFSFDKWLYPFLAPFVAKKLRPDIIHAVLETFAVLALYFCRFICTQPKRMLTLQTTNRRLFKKSIIKSAHKVTAISSPLITIAKECGADVVQISNGLHISSIPEIEKEKGTIVFVGRLEKMKGIDVLLLAVSKCKMQNVKCKMRIVGEGSQRKSLEELSKSLGLQDIVTFTGFVPVPHVYEEFAKAEIFCGLSRSEALGNVFLEAQAAGCAVLGTTVGGIPDIVENGVTGLLIPPDDVEVASDALIKLLNDAELRLKLSENGKKNAENYDWSELAEKYANIYDEVINE